jgi:hypothetical protein
MVDVPRVPGASGSSDQVGKDKGKVDADKFKEFMKIDKTDPELLKKRKRQEEAEEEKKQKILGGRAPREKAPPEFERIQKPKLIEKVAKTDEGQTKKKKRSEEAPAECPEEEGIVITPAAKVAPFEVKSKETGEAEKVGGSTYVPPPQPPIEEVIEEALTPEEIPAFSEEKALPKAEKKEAPTSREITLPPQPAMPMPLFLPSASEVPSPSIFLRAEILALFERMAVTLTAADIQGIHETMIHLNTPEFAGSIFAGARIIIREYATAPKIFNIEFQGNAANMALFQASTSDMLAAFQHGQYNFKINRIDAGLLAEDRPLFHRKEKPGEKEMSGGEKETR